MPTTQRRAYSYQRNGKTVHVRAHPMKTRGRTATRSKPVSPPLKWTLLGAGLSISGSVLFQFIPVLGVAVLFGAVVCSIIGLQKVRAAQREPEPDQEPTPEPATPAPNNRLALAWQRVSARRAKARLERTPVT